MTEVKYNHPTLISLPCHQVILLSFIFWSLTYIREELTLLGEAESHNSRDNLTPCSKDLLQKLICVQPIKLVALYRIRSSIPVLIKAQNLLTQDHVNITLPSTPTFSE
jgi:hypothetical protein